MSCAPLRTDCPPPTGYMAFFKGTQGDKGDPGAASVVPGPDGPQGVAGQIGVYTHTYNPDGTYFDTDVRKDIVEFNGQFWIVTNPAKSGLNGWGVPTGDDWAPFGLPLPIVATKIVLLYPAEINQEVVLSPDAPGGLLKSDNFVQNTTGQGAGWAFTGLGGAEINDLNSKFRGLISTDTPRFNFESITRTMPSVGYAEFPIEPVEPGDIPVNPLVNEVTDDAMIFFGWKQGANNYIENRFGHTSQKFLINVQGIGQADGDLFFIQVYYRLRVSGGAWGAWVVVGQDAYMQPDYGINQSFQNTQTLRVTLLGTNDIQFAAGFSTGAAGSARVNGARISVEAYN